MTTTEKLEFKLGFDKVRTMLATRCSTSYAKEMALSFKISSKPIKNPYVKDTGKKYCKMLPNELTEGKLIIHILHILL